MALTRKSLKAMGLTDEQVDSIVEMHSETVDGLKDKLKAAEDAASKLEGVQKELDTLKAGDDYKAKYEAVKKSFEDYKADITAKETKAAKEKAVREASQFKEQRLIWAARETYSDKAFFQFMQVAFPKNGKPDYTQRTRAVEKLKQDILNK